LYTHEASLRKITKTRDIATLGKTRNEAMRRKDANFVLVTTLGGRWQAAQFETVP